MKNNLSNKEVYLAIDLGAGSGRGIIGYINSGQIELDEIHRFENNPVKLAGTLHWNFLSLFENIKKAIALTVQKGYTLRGIGVDTWGVDYGLLDSSGKLIGNPVAYRDSRTEGTSEQIDRVVSKAELYESTGIQLMEINTLFQLFAQQNSSDPALKNSEKLLFMPDLINYFLTGKTHNEYTIASTSQLLNAETKKWDDSLFTKLSLPQDRMQKLIFPGEVVGKLSTELAEETGAGEVPVFAVGSHDTASAIGAIPLAGENQAFLSSGTWSLLGILSEKPVLTADALANDFTNEGGVDDKILLMRNITGLWLLQRLIAEWKAEEGKAPEYDDLLAEAAEATPFRSLVNSDDPLFSNPVQMGDTIRQFCRDTGQPEPETKGEFVRCVLESLAIKYSIVLEKMEAVTERKIEQIFIVGGGSKNQLLNQFIADATGKEIITGLTEGTALGNIMQQMIAGEKLANWAEAHQIIRNSFSFESFHPQNKNLWQDTIKLKKHLF